MGWVAAAIGIGQAVGGIFGALKQKSVTKSQTELQFRDNLEKIRRRKFTQEQTLGTGTAFSEASGILHSGGSSAQGFLDTMAREFRLELDWMRRFADEARRLGHRGASAAFTTNILGSISSGISTGISAYGSLGGGGGGIQGGGTKVGGPTTKAPTQGR